MKKSVVFRWRLIKCASRKGDCSQVVCPAIFDPECLGLEAFYAILLDKAGKVVVSILKLFADSSNFPIMFHCTHGKDRTGIIAAILAMLGGVPDEVFQNFDS